MPVLHFEVKCNLIVGGQTHTTGLQASPDLNSYGGSLQASAFVLNSWIGDNNEESSTEKVLFDNEKLSAEGKAVVKLNLDNGNVNTVKLEYNFVTPTTSGDRLHHLCSSFIPVADLMDHLDGKNTNKCYMKNNFSKDAALMEFKNISTDTGAVRLLKLRPSALLQQEVLNKAVFSMGTALKQKLVSCDVNNINAGPQFVEGLTFLPMQGVLTNYGLMGFTFKCLESPINLDCTMYNAYKTLEATGLDIYSLSSMSDKDLFFQFGAHLATRSTSCAFTTPYSPDLTYDCIGRITKDTESITRCMSAVALQTQGAVKNYEWVFTPNQTLADSVQVLSKPDIHDNTKIREGMSYALLNDDCEDAALGVILHLEGVASLARNFDTPTKLAQAMAQAAHNNRLFAGFTMDHHSQMAESLHRLGTLANKGKLQAAFSVVSARAACAENASDAHAGNTPQLSGHGTVIGRLTDCNGDNHFIPLEGTSYIVTDQPFAKGLANEIILGLQDGSEQKFDLAKAQTIFAQNLHEIAGLSPHSRVLGHLLSEYKDPVNQAPFFVSLFYSGLQQNTQTFGCVPLDTAAGQAPMFGAPVMGLSRESSIAIPLTPYLMTNNGEDPKKLMQLICAHANEVFPPKATDAQMKALMSCWQPCAPPSRDTLTIDPTRHLRAECTSAFDNPQHTTAAVRVYQELAAKFNQLQTKTRDEDGIRIEGYGTFLSAALKMKIPIPSAKNPRLKTTAIKNLRAAVAELKLDSIVTQPCKMAHINTQAQIPSNHAFFMCSQGGGLVHSHAIKLA